MSTRAAGVGDADGTPALRVTWLGHSTVVLDLDGVRVVTDPLLKPHAGLLRRLAPRPDPAQWQAPDVVLLSHLHHDHAELGSLRMLPGVPVLGSAPVAAWLHRHGVRTARALSDSAWSRVGGTVEVLQVRADHEHRPMPHRPNAAHGHLVRGPSATVWGGGDTSLHPDMFRLGELAGSSVDLALVPVWGWGPRLSGGHMDPTEAAEAVARSGARCAIPVHWGTLHPPLLTRFGRDWLDRPGERFAEALGRGTPGATALVLEPGQSVAVPVAAQPGECH